MSQPFIQASFNGGEWSPKLFSRVDIAKYKSGAALLHNWFVDYRGGASTRPGTRFIQQCLRSDQNVRLIPFQVSFDVGYMLEFGDRYIRFYYNGSPLLEPAIPIQGGSQGAHVYVFGQTEFNIGDWVYISGTGSPTELNGNYYIISNRGALTSVGASYGLNDLFGRAVNGAGMGAFAPGSTMARVYTIQSPYLGHELPQLKYTQNTNELIICQPNHPVNSLKLNGASDWVLLPMVIGSTATPPNAPTLSITPGGTGSAYYSYVVTAIDANEQESSASAVGTLGPQPDMRSVANTVQVSWTAVAGAVGYNVYRANISYFGAAGAGATYGFVGSTQDTTFTDNNIGPNFELTPPVSRNPFIGNGIDTITVTVPGNYTTVPSVALTGVTSSVAASAAAVLQVQNPVDVNSGGSGYQVGDTVSFSGGVVLQVASVTGNGTITAWYSITSIGSQTGSVLSGATPPNPVEQISTSGSGTRAEANLIWGVGQVLIQSPGGGYTIRPSVRFTPEGAEAIATISSAAGGNPTVPGFFQQRLMLAAPSKSPQTFYMSRPGAPNNFDVSSISRPTDAITGTLVSGVLNTIKAIVPQSAGLLVFTDKNTWMINGGSPGSAISPTGTVANAQAFNGISDVPPIISNFDILYVQAKGSIVRDATYNVYYNVFSGADISMTASHLFYGYTISEWAWAEEPFKVVWAVRSDGTMLTLTFLKEQEFVGWSHSTTPGGRFLSVASVVETTDIAGSVDAIYTVVERQIAGRTVKYIERVAERAFPRGLQDAWTVDCGIGYSGAPATFFRGASFLAGRTVTGLADGQVITPFVMPASGNFTLPRAASRVVIGLGFTCDLQTLPLDMGEPTVQGKLKKIDYVDVLVSETLGLSIGPDFEHLAPMKDLIRGNVSSMRTGQNSGQVVDGLVDGHARTFLGAAYTVPGQYCIRQSDPLPATVLGVVPNVTVGEGGQRTR